MADWRRNKKDGNSSKKGKQKSLFGKKQLRAHVASLLKEQQQSDVAKAEKMDEAKACLASMFSSAGLNPSEIATIAASRAVPEAQKASNKRVKFNEPPIDADAAAEICAAKFMAALSMEKKG